MPRDLKEIYSRRSKPHESDNDGQDFIDISLTRRAKQLPCAMMHDICMPDSKQKKLYYIDINGFVKQNIGKRWKL